MKEYSRSQSVTVKSGSNLAATFFLLPRDRQKAMVALYAFCREVDDVADDDNAPLAIRSERLEEWRVDIRKACEWGEPSNPVCRELRPYIRKYSLPLMYFEELISGMEADLVKTRYRDFDELQSYCYRAASVVGLLSIRIFECAGESVEHYAENLGHALQLTNILRDVAEDAKRGRIYLPQSVMDKHGVHEDDILRGRFSSRYLNVAQEVAERAWAHYRLARESFPSEQKGRLVAAECMGTVYWQLLRRLRAAEYNVLSSDAKRIRVGRLKKLFIGLLIWVRAQRKSYMPSYGYIGWFSALLFVPQFYCEIYIGYWA